jgi:2-polyprenyl-6-methoxyphenol hydroxylase-like FAD-dependent oxidoreductase
MEIFRVLGLEEAIQAVGVDMGGWPRLLAMQTLDGPVLESVPFQNSGDPDDPAWPSPTRVSFCAQDMLDPILVRTLGRAELAELQFGTEVSGLRPDPAGVTAELTDRRDGTRRTVRADYLIAADGANSSIREALGIGMTGHDISAEIGAHHVWAASAAALVTAAAHHGDLARARKLAAEAGRVGAESGNHQIHGWGLGLLGLVTHLERDAEEAVRLAEAAVAELLRVPDHIGAVTGLGVLARAQLRAGHLNAAASTIAHVSTEVDKRGFRGTQIIYQVEAAAEYALLGLATDNNAATRKVARRAIRGSLRQKHLARLHAVHAHVLAGGMRWILGQERRAERSFARAQSLAQHY